MARKTKEDADKTRQAILDSALQIFYEKGFSRTTFDEIAKRINLTKGAVYWHFRNKADVISAIIRQKISEHEVDSQNEIVDTLADLRQVCINRAVQIENSDETKRFLFFMLYRMEWSEPVLNSVWKQIGNLSGIQDKRLSDCLQKLQKKGELSTNSNINMLVQLLLCLWRGCINEYISGCKNIERLSTLIAQGFDAIMTGTKVESK